MSAQIQQMLQQMHECARVLTDTTGRATQADRTQAQNVFLDFQKTKNPFELCRELLEATEDQFVLYQVGTCLKNGVIRDWDSLWIEQGRALFEYLFNYAQSKPLEPYVISELMFVVALIIKRLNFFDRRAGESDRELIERLCECMKNTTISPVVRMNAAIAINLLLTELASISNNDFASSWYTQLTTKIHFERYRLKKIYETLCETLYNHLKLPAAELASKESQKFLLKITSNCEVILTWVFSSNVETVMATIHATMMAYRFERFEKFYPPADWMPLIVDGNVGFFFEVYLAFRSLNNEDLVYKAMVCLNQLSSFTANEKVFVRDVRARYLSNFVQSIIRVMSTIYDQISPKEQVFFANIVNNICVHFRTQCLIRFLDYNLVRQFLEIVSKLTCDVFKISTQMLDDEEKMEHYTQAINHLTNSWMIASMAIQMVHSIAKSSNEGEFAGFITHEELQRWSKPIVDDYIRSHLAAPEGFLQPSAYTQDDDEVNEFEENDNEKFKEQLATIGEIASINVEHTLDTLNRLFLLKMQQYEMVVSSQNISNEEKMQAWVCVSENIHWILLIITHVLHNSDDSDIPHCVTELANERRWDLIRTQTALQTADVSLVDGVDPVIRILVSIIKFVNMEEYLLKNGGGQWISPQVSLTLTQFINKFMNTYLIPMHFDLEDEEYVESVLISVLNKHSDTANHLLGFFLDHMANKFMLMSSEHELLNSSAAGLYKFSRNKDRMAALKKSNTLRVLAQKFGSNEFPSAPCSLRRSMYQLFVTIYADELDFIILPLAESYKKFVHELKNGGNKEQVRTWFLQIADCTIGLANGVTTKVYAQCWTKFHSFVYADLPHIMVEMHNYSNVVQMILQMMFQFSVMFVSFFSTDESIEFFNTSFAVLKEYAKFNKDKQTTDSLRMEELEEEFSWILRFLQEISNRDIFFFDIFISNSPSSLTDVINNVIFTSIHILLPVMRIEMLQNEKLCGLYYKLLETLASDSDRFKNFPRDLFHSLIQSVHYAFKTPNISLDVKNISFKIIIELCLQVRLEPEKNTEILSSLETFFGNVLQFIFQDLNYHSDKGVMNLVAVALYMLICCFPDTYNDKIRAAMNIHDNPEVITKIQTRLFEIVEDVGLDGTINHNRLRFKARFPDFVKFIVKELSLR